MHELKETYDLKAHPTANTGTTEENTLTLRTQFPLSLSSKKNPIGIASEHLSAASGKNQPLCLLYCLSAVGAAVGASMKVSGITGVTETTGTFHTLAITDSPALQDNLLLSWPFKALSNQVSEDIEEVAGTSDHTLKQEAESARRQLRNTRADTTAALAILRSIPELPEGLIPQLLARAKRDQDQGVIASHGSKEEAALEYLDCLEREEEAEKAVVSMARRSQPLVVAESLSPRQITSYQKLGLGGNCCNLDLDGTSSLLALFGSTPKLRREVFEILRRAFDSQCRVDEELKHHRAPGFSYVGICQPIRLQKLLHDTQAQETGIPDRILAIKLSDFQSGPANLIRAQERPDAFDALLLELYEHRIKSPQQEYHLSKGAVNLLNDFVSSLDSVFPSSMDSPRGVHLWPKLAVKFALLLHIGDGRKNETCISAGCMEKALGLLAVLGTSHVNLVQNLQEKQRKEAAEKDMETEIEVLVSKVRMKGRATLRDLQRSYHRARVETIEPVLDKALADGLIRKVDGSFEAAALVHLLPKEKGPVGYTFLRKIEKSEETPLYYDLTNAIILQDFLTITYAKKNDQIP